MKIDFLIEGRYVNKISLTMRLAGHDKLPEVRALSGPGPKMEFFIPYYSMHDEVLNIIITLQGALGIYSYFEIDHQNVSMKFFPETEEEKNTLQLHGFSTQKPQVDLSKARDIDAEIVARTILSSIELKKYQIHLSFLRRAKKNIIERSFIEAFYNLFFIIEMLYVPGYSNPKSIKKILKRNNNLRISIEKSSGYYDVYRKKRSMDEMSTDEIIDEIVDTRGNLHHHRGPGSSKTWHPEKSSEYEEYVDFIHSVCTNIMLDLVHKITFSEKTFNDLMSPAKEDGRTREYRVALSYKSADNDAPLKTLILRTPALEITRERLLSVNRRVQQILSAGRLSEKISGYLIRIDDDNLVRIDYNLYDIKI